MAFAVWTAVTEITTMVLPDIATEMKRTELISLPLWYSLEVRPTIYSSLNDKATMIVANRLRIRKG